MKTLIVVESPGKVPAITRYARQVLTGEVEVQASLGHLRDLPRGKLGVDIEGGFRPNYQVSPGRTKAVEQLRAAIRKADRVLLATDPDREGEAVAWHVVKVFEAELAGKTVERISFNAITRQAIQTALAFPQKLDTRLVQSAVARRVLDRLVGYTISPRLWQAVSDKDHSAGRVQTVALRLLAEHSREKPASWAVDVEV